ncbi:hypothetical protein BY458DRAFT_554724 [Sporodiniella umbellata]|nr:hypothetical protein BY458DRAFT_554724 [Sporodiniella umbellata]
MADLFKSKENEFYIKLKQERYYFPGEDVFGDIVLDLKKATKTNNIKITLEGHAAIGGKDWTIYSKSILVAEPPEGEKSYYLDAFTHRFPFRMTIPTDTECSLPSTLEIPNLLKVSYRLVAVHNRPFIIMEKFCSTTTETVTILEDINVEANGLNEPYDQTRELALTGETRKVRVVINLGKCAAVKGDTIPVKITVHHIGVMVRDRAIKVELMRCVYYGKNKSELFGPKVLSEAITNIDISGPMNFTKSFTVKLPVPSALACPTVEDSCALFRIEYFIRATINLNEESPLRQEQPSDIVIFNIPFIVGTHPKLAFNIDDDDDGDDDTKETTLVHEMSEVSINNDSEYEKVFENMKQVTSTPPENLPVSEEKDYTKIKPLPRLEQPPSDDNNISSSEAAPALRSPVKENFHKTAKRYSVCTDVSPTTDSFHPSPQEEEFGSSLPKRESNLYKRESMRWVAQEGEKNKYFGPHRQDSMRWVEAPKPLPMPTPSTSTPVAFPHPNNNYGSPLQPSLLNAPSQTSPPYPHPYPSQTPLHHLPYPSQPSLHYPSQTSPHYPSQTSLQSPYPSQTSLQSPYPSQAYSQSQPTFHPEPSMPMPYEHHPINPTHAYYHAHHHAPLHSRPAYPHPNTPHFPTPNPSYSQPTYTSYHS